MIVHRSQVRVATADLDPAGIVWYGNFIRFLESAEDEFFRGRGHQRHDFPRTHGVVLARTDFACRFRSPAHADDLVDVLLHDVDVSDAGVVLRFEMRHAQSGRQIAVGTAAYVFAHPQTFEPVPLPRDRRGGFLERAAGQR